VSWPSGVPRPPACHARSLQWIGAVGQGPGRTTGGGAGRTPTWLTDAQAWWVGKINRGLGRMGSWLTVPTSPLRSGDLDKRIAPFRMSKSPIHRSGHQLATGCWSPRGTSARRRRDG
jgi:hypothetical protein